MAATRLETILYFCNGLQKLFFKNMIRFYFVFALQLNLCTFEVKLRAEEQRLKITL